jgi:DNA repair exonuclease SbcCD ATPase subunit
MDAVRNDPCRALTAAASWRTWTSTRPLSSCTGSHPEQFIAARNDLAQTATAAGDPQTSAAIKSLRKPTLSAWLANQLVRADPDGINNLTELGEELRQAHLSADGARLRRLTYRRHALVAELVKTARAHAQELGHPVSEQIAQKFRETLDAALIDPGAAQILRTGHLTSALRHVGFGVVDETGEPAQLAPLKPRVVRSTRPKPLAKRVARRARTTSTADDALNRRRAELESRAQEAEADYAHAESERAQAEAELDAHDDLKSDLKAAIERLTDELEHARQQLREAERRNRRLQLERDRTTRNAAAAQRRRDANQQRLANLEG